MTERTTPMHNRTDSSLIALRRILRATELFGRDLARSAGLTPVQYRVLQVVDETRDCTAKVISTRMGVSQATVTSLVDKLVAKGMVTRERSERDRRQSDIRVTENGKAALEKAPDALQQRFVQKFENLQNWEQAQIIASLERVASMLDADSMDAAPVLHSGDITAQG